MVVVAQNTTGGRLRVVPNGDASAGDISWDTGSVGASGSFTVPVNPDGTITIEAGTATTLRLSVTGYWKLPSGTDTGLGLDLLDAPTRLIDTTTETGTCNPDPCDRLVATAPVVIDVAGQADLDEDISAVMIAVTVIDPGMLFGDTVTTLTATIHAAGLDVGDVEVIVVNRVASRMNDIDIATPSRDVSSGMPAAIADPRVSTSTTDVPMLPITDSTERRRKWPARLPRYSS